VRFELLYIYNIRHKHHNKYFTTIKTNLRLRFIQKLKNPIGGLEAASFHGVRRDGGAVYSAITPGMPKSV
jgi:hypothetical protein